MTSPTWYPGIQIAGFLLTYALHSTLLLGAAWLLSRFVFQREAWRDIAWKGAILGSLVTTAVAQVPGRDWALRLSVPIPSAVSEARPTQLRPAEAGLPAAAESILPTLDAVGGLVPLFLVLSWGTIALVLLARLTRKRARLHSTLRDRRPVPGGPLPVMLEDLRRSTTFEGTVRLSYSDSIPTPLALGRSEICLPARFFHRLSKDEQRAALAHEMAHLVRRDPMWQHAAQVLTAVFFFQPLQAVAITKLRESAELLADAWAVRETGSPLGLARCLGIVAHWISLAGAHESAASTPMAEAGSPLMTRVRRLLSGEVEEVDLPGALRVAALAVVTTVAVFGPAVVPRGLAHEAVEETPQVGTHVGVPAPEESVAVVGTPAGLAPVEPKTPQPERAASISARAARATAEVPIPEPASTEATVSAEAASMSTEAASMSDERIRSRLLAVVPALADLGRPAVALAPAPVRLEAIEVVREPTAVPEGPVGWVVVSRHVDPADFGDLGGLLDEWSMNERALERRFTEMVVTHFRGARATPSSADVPEVAR